MAHRIHRLSIDVGFEAHTGSGGGADDVFFGDTGVNLEKAADVSKPNLGGQVPGLEGPPVRQADINADLKDLGDYGDIRRWAFKTRNVDLGHAPLS